MWLWTWQCSHMRDKIILFLTKPPHTFRSTTGKGAAPTITVRLGLAEPALASNHWKNTYKSCCHLAQCCVNLYTSNSCPKLNVSLIFRLTKSHLFFIPEAADSFGNINITSSKTKPGVLFISCDSPFGPKPLSSHPYESCSHCATSANKPLLKGSFSLIFSFASAKDNYSRCGSHRGRVAPSCKSFVTPCHHYPTLTVLEKRERWSFDPIWTSWAWKSKFL